jgi:hypothetical protein
MAEMTATQQKHRTRNIVLTLCATPCYVGALFMAFLVVAHKWNLGPHGDAPGWVAALAILVLYVGGFCWGFGLIPAGVAVVLLAWDFWRKQSVTQSGIVVPLFVMGAPVAWILSLPCFLQALKW